MHSPENVHLNKDLLYINLINFQKEKGDMEKLIKAFVEALRN